MGKVCSIPACNKRSYIRGWCEAHYTRWRRHGDPLGGGKSRPRSGEQIEWIREIAFNHVDDECLDWPFGTARDGYGRIWLDGKHITSNRAVCIVAHGDPPSPKYDSAHSCGNRVCVNPRHLRWATRAENNADKLAHGTDRRGEKCPTSKLTGGEVLEIRKLADQGAPQVKLAKKFGVSESHISCIVNRKVWAWL